jgi:predicted NAD/FAD-dependent oxidoreductase
LREARVLIVERAAVLGGRVLTAGPADARLDLGACFAFNPELLPTSAGTDQRGPIAERDPIGILHRGALVFAASPWECIEALPLTVEVRQALADFRAGDVDAGGLPAEARQIVGAFFAQIHPGDVAAYAPERQNDALASWFPDHWPSGNVAAVEALRAHGTAQVWLGCEVLRLEQEPRRIVVIGTSDGVVRRITAAAVVLATPATVARRLVVPADAACRAFLASVRYGRYTVVAFSVSGEDTPPPFRYIVTPDLQLSLVMQQRSGDRARRTLLCYYADAAAPLLDVLDDRTLLRTARADLTRLGVLSHTASVDFQAVQRWELSGTILSPDFAAGRGADFHRATERIYLAGDYLAPPPGWGYGMDDAVASGRRTGAALAAALPELLHQARRS